MADQKALPEGIELLDSRYGNLFVRCRKEKFERIRDLVFAEFGIKDIDKETIGALMIDWKAQPREKTPGDTVWLIGCAVISLVLITIMWFGVERIWQALTGN